jgi:hypothetical protein
MTSDRDALIVALYEEGVPVAEIAEVAGVCMKTGVGGAGPAQRQPDLYAAQGERFWRK